MRGQTIAAIAVAGAVSAATVIAAVAPASGATPPPPTMTIVETSPQVSAWSFYPSGSSTRYSMLARAIMVKETDKNSSGKVIATSPWAGTRATAGSGDEATNHIRMIATNYKSGSACGSQTFTATVAPGDYVTNSTPALCSIKGSFQSRGQVISSDFSGHSAYTGFTTAYTF